MPDVYCPICNNAAFPIVKKGNYEYLQCNNCETVFTGFIEQDGLVGGEFEVERNTNQNHLRVDRVNEIIKGLNKEDIHILDFGCGTGYFIEDLKKAGYPNVTGYDAYNDKFWRLPEKEKYTVIVATEVFEHFCAPFQEIDVIYRALKPGAAALIETSFIDVAREEGIPSEDFFYIAPQSGHSTIFSHHSLDLLMAIRGFIPMLHFDRHVRLFRKPYK